MKKLILILAMVLSSQVFAADCTTDVSEDKATDWLIITTNTPKHLKGAKITVTLADGTSSTVPAEKFKVVPRKQQSVVTRVERNKVTSCTVKGESSKNRVSVLGGYGPNGGLKTTNPAPYTTQVDPDHGVTGGLQYQRSITDRFSLGVQGQTNKSGSVLLGVDF